MRVTFRTHACISEPWQSSAQNSEGDIEHKEYTSDTSDTLPICCLLSKKPFRRLSMERYRLNTEMEKEAAEKQMIADALPAIQAMQQESEQSDDDEDNVDEEEEDEDMKDSVSKALGKRRRLKKEKAKHTRSVRSRVVHDPTVVAVARRLDDPEDYLEPDSQNIEYSDIDKLKHLVNMAWVCSPVDRRQQEPDAQSLLLKDLESLGVQSVETLMAETESEKIGSLIRQSYKTCLLMTPDQEDNEEKRNNSYQRLQSPLWFRELLFKEHVHEMGSHMDAKVKITELAEKVSHPGEKWQVQSMEGDADQSDPSRKVVDFKEDEEFVVQFCPDCKNKRIFFDGRKSDVNWNESWEKAKDQYEEESKDRNAMLAEKRLKRKVNPSKVKVPMSEFPETIEEKEFDEKEFVDLPEIFSGVQAIKAPMGFGKSTSLKVAIVVKLWWQRRYPGFRASEEKEFEKLAKPIVELTLPAPDPKTHKEWWDRLRTFVDHPSGKRYLFVTMRRIYAQGVYYDYFNTFNKIAEEYTDYVGHYDMNMTTWSWHDLPDIFICNQESLRKMINPSFDVVVLDEVMSLIHNVCNMATHKEQLCNNFDTLMSSCVQAEWTLCMDAGLGIDNRFTAFLLEYFDRKQEIANFIRSSGLPSLVKIHTYTKVKDVNRRHIQIVHKSEGLTLFNDYVSRGLRVMVPSRSLAGMKNILAYVYQFVKESNVQKISSKLSSTSRMNQSSFLLNENLRGETKVLCFTASITHGVDIQAPVDAVFLFANYWHGPLVEVSFV